MASTRAVRVLGIESSCDEAAVAVVADGRSVLAEAVASQAEDFASWGGVVPEIAARGHVLALPGLVERVLAEAGMRPAELDAVAVCARPGLVGSLLPGVTTAKILAARLGIPLLAVDHVQAHLAAIHLSDGRSDAGAGGSGDEAAAPGYPLVGLVASGGHSHLYACAGPGVCELIGGTIDDAAGEAFDKAAATLGLGYPGGPAVERAAVGGDPRALALPRSFLGDGSLRLSFAGLKTALLYQVRGPLGRDPLTLDAQGVRDASASFQAAVVDCLVGKLAQAASARAVTAIACGGGVACNAELRRRLARLAEERGWRLHLPAARHCSDNGAMIAALGHHLLLRGEVSELTLAPRPSGASAR